MSYYFKVDKSDAFFQSESMVYDPPLVDYHYRLEWDLIKDHDFAPKHQVRIFDQGGQEGLDAFDRYKSDILAAKAAGMVENVSWSYREVTITPDWLAGAPTHTEEN